MSFILASAGTGENSKQVGTIAWATPGACTASDDSDATAAMTSGLISNYLIARNFSFTVPVGATITGILVEIEKSAASAVIQDSQIKLIVNGTVGSTNKASGSNWGASDAYSSYGSSTDTWDETLTPARVNDASFGVAIAVTATGTETATIDHVRMTVFYTLETQAAGSTDLVTIARATDAMSSTLTVRQEAIFAKIITAVSKAIKKYCKRDFTQTTYDELYNGNNKTKLWLRQSPIISVARVAYDPKTVLSITNTSSSNQRATVSVTSSGLSLVRVASGTSTTSTLAFASYATITLLAAAIDALGNGWDATVEDSDFDNWASADLRSVQGALNAKDVDAPLKIHTSEVYDYEVDERGWLIKGPSNSIWNDMPPLWDGGVNYWRIIYSAGYATIPEDIQEACASWAAARYHMSTRDPTLANTFGSSTGSSFSQASLGTPPDLVRGLLQPYRQTNILGPDD